MKSASAPARIQKIKPSVKKITIQMMVMMVPLRAPMSSQLFKQAVLQVPVAFRSSWMRHGAAKRTNAIFRNRTVGTVMKTIERKSTATKLLEPVLSKIPAPPNVVTKPPANSMTRCGVEYG